MKLRLMVTVIIMSFVALFLCQTAVAGDPVKDAKNAYTQFVTAAKANNSDAVKKLLTKEALDDLEKNGAFDLFIGMQADIRPETIEAAKAEVKGSTVVLTIEQVEKTKEGTTTSKGKIYMVKEGGQWKVTKPEGVE